MSERLARCLRCGAPAGHAGDPGGRLVPLRGFRGMQLYASRRRGGLRRPRGYVHADRAFCERRVPTRVRAERRTTRA